MGLNYDKIKAKQESGGNQWTSYSDLFMVLSFVFLLLYVVASLRNGTMTYSTQLQLQNSKAEVEELKKQLRVYDVLKSKYLQTGASEKEKETYDKLMAKLELLEEKAKREKKELRKQAKENEIKQYALNKYQSLIKNIINANMLAQSKIKDKDKIIQEKEESIDKLQSNIKDLQKNVNQKENLISKNEKEISKIQRELEKQIKQVKYAYRSKAKAKKRLMADIKKLKKSSQRKISSLRRENQQHTKDLQIARSMIKKKNKSLREKELTNRELANELEKTKKRYSQRIDTLKKAHEAELYEDRASFDTKIKKLKKGSAQRLAKEREFRAKIERKNKAYEAKLAAARENYEGTLSELSARNELLQRGLSIAKRKVNERRNLAKKIKYNFKKAGIVADVDIETGEVTISFKDSYFNTNQAHLKRKMKKTLDKLVPVYAKSLFSDKAISKKLDSVEIVGFASPTYNQKFVNPLSLAPKDRKAVNYNLDLSYQRARSIFNYIFDKSKMVFKYQKSLLPYVKVTGRSYLASDHLLRARVPAGMSADTFCVRYNCKKSQKVIIKFYLKDK